MNGRYLGIQDPQNVVKAVALVEIQQPAGSAPESCNMCLQEQQTLLASQGRESTWLNSHSDHINKEKKVPTSNSKQQKRIINKLISTVEVHKIMDPWE